MLLVSSFLRRVITSFLLSDSESAAMSVKWSKIFQDKTNRIRSPKTITAAILHDHVKLFVSVGQLCITGHSNFKVKDIGFKMQVVVRIFLYSLPLNGDKTLA